MLCAVLGDLLTATTAATEVQRLLRRQPSAPCRTRKRLGRRASAPTACRGPSQRPVPAPTGPPGEQCRADRADFRSSLRGSRGVSADPAGGVLDRQRMRTTTHLCRQWPATHSMVGVRCSVITRCLFFSVNSTLPGFPFAPAAVRTSQVSTVCKVAVARLADTATGPMMRMRGSGTSTCRGQPFVCRMMDRLAGP